jgi:hypothetical protein
MGTRKTANGCESIFATLSPALPCPSATVCVVVTRWKGGSRHKLPWARRELWPKGRHGGGGGWSASWQAGGEGPGCPQFVVWPCAWPGGWGGRGWWRRGSIALIQAASQRSMPTQRCAVRGLAAADKPRGSLQLRPESYSRSAAQQISTYYGTRIFITALTIFPYWTLSCASWVHSRPPHAYILRVLTNSMEQGPSWEADSHSAS